MNAEYVKKLKMSESALVIVDCQRDFMYPGAPLENPLAMEKLPNIISAKKWAYEHGIPVIYTKEVHRRQKIDFGLEMERGDPEHCVETSGGEEIVDEFKPDLSRDYVVTKRRYSGFYLTDMEILLHSLGVKTLILTGFDTNVCVYATALDAQFRGFRVIALSDCTHGTTDEFTKAFLDNIDYILGEVMTLGELKELWKDQ